MSRWAVRAVLAVAALALAITVVPDAFAHAELVSTSPADRSVLSVSPPRVTLRFNEPVETVLGSIRVFDADARQVGGGRLSSPARAVVGVELPVQLSDGTYTVVWRVVSDDGHPVDGSFTFSVGEAVAVAPSVTSNAGTPTRILVGFWMVRFLSLLLVLAIVGGTFILAAALRDANARLLRSLLALVALAAGLLVPVSLVGVVFQGAEAGEQGFLRAAHWDVVSSVLGTRFGEAWLSRALRRVAFPAIGLDRSHEKAMHLGKPNFGCRDLFRLPSRSLDRTTFFRCRPFRPNRGRCFSVRCAGQPRRRCSGQIPRLGVHCALRSRSGDPIRRS